MNENDENVKKNAIEVIAITTQKHTDTAKHGSASNTVLLYLWIPVNIITHEIVIAYCYISCWLLRYPNGVNCCYVVP